MTFQNNVKVVGFALGILLVLVMMPCTVLAVPQEIHYQGYLTDADGNPLNGTVAMIFRIWDAPGAGTQLWSESHAAVTLTEGVFNVVLGSSAPITVAILHGDCYLGIKVGEDDEMVPRQRFTSTPFALKAAHADDADNLDGLDSSDFAETFHNHSFGEITGTPTDAQIPDDVTITYAATSGSATTADSAATAGYATSAGTANTATTAGDCDTLDDQHASAFAGVSHTHDTRYYTEAEVNSIVSGLEARIAQLESLLQNVTRKGNDITFSGVNVRIVNGTGTTDGNPNSLGNLIVGYNELRGSGDDRSGSHNIVAGSKNNYSSYGGLVACHLNTISGAYATVSGGTENTASGAYSSVSGGANNTSEASFASVSGGNANEASSDYSSVTGGSDNVAIGRFASLSGGNGSTASGNYASVSGGNYNTANGDFSSVSGGYYNTASGWIASVSGGRYNEAIGDCSYIGGGGHPTNPDRANKAYADYSAILGGAANETGSSADQESARASSISGGYDNNTSQMYSSVSGGRSNMAAGQYSTVIGGISNTANNDYDSVVGDQGQVYVDGTPVH